MDPCPGASVLVRLVPDSRPGTNRRIVLEALAAAVRATQAVLTVHEGATPVKGRRVYRIPRVWYAVLAGGATTALLTWVGAYILAASVAIVILLAVRTRVVATDTELIFHNVLRTRRAQWSEIAHVHTRADKEAKLVMLTMTLHSGHRWSAYAVADPLTDKNATRTLPSQRIAHELDRRRQARTDSGT
jgi:hypothetical protein